MKLKYLFSIILASALLIVGCQPESTDSFENIKLDKTFVPMSMDGETVKVKITATEAWQFVRDENWPEVLEFKDKIKPAHDKFGNVTNMDVVGSKKASWLKASAMDGLAGETIVEFTAGSTKAGREIEISLYAGNNIQYIRFRQGSLDPVEFTNKEVYDKAAAGGSYITSGIVTDGVHYSNYGKFKINDGTSDKDVEVYGQTDESMEDFPKVEVGDFVKITGTWTSYGNFDDVVILEHVKSLLKVTSETEPTVSAAGGELKVKVAYKGKGVFPSVDKEAESWISYAGMEYKEGIPSKLEKSPADTAIVTFNVGKTDKSRGGKIYFSSYDGKDKSDATVLVNQVAEKDDIKHALTLVGYKSGLLEGQVTAISTKGYVLTGEDVSIFVSYQKDFKPEDYKLGQNRKAAGKIGLYNFGGQVEVPTTDVLVSEGTIASSDATELTVEKCKEIQTKTKDKDGTKERLVDIEFVKVTGTLKVDKGYINVVFTDEEDVDISVYNPVEALKTKAEALNGKTVTVTGYMTSISGGKHVCVIPNEIEEKK